MSAVASESIRGVFTAAVISNRQVGQRFYKLKLEFSGAAAKAFAGFRPGQFIQLDLSSAAIPSCEKIPEDLADAAKRQVLLRRPFSFTDVTIQRDKTVAELLYRIVGPATLRMTTLSAGGSVSVIGPLGNGFRIVEGKKTAILVIGGMGAPPIQCLAKLLTTSYSDIDVIVFAGAKTADQLPFENKLDEISQQLGFSLPEFARFGVKSQIATDDGSAGYHGLVTDCLEQWLSENPEMVRDEIIIYACGPEAMLAEVAKIAEHSKIDCQVSMERMMACGIGLCQSCAVECRVNGSNETVYKLCCEDGSVFNAREVVFKT
jgi:dihydroorotate dehydrogenase electron transfer subunit